MRSLNLLAALCILLAGCSPPGPSAEIKLGWGHSIQDLAKLEEVFALQGFQPDPTAHISTGSPTELKWPWRYEVDGNTFSYFQHPASGTSELRAVIALSDGIGRLRVGIYGNGSCQDEVFTKERKEQLSKLAAALGDRFKRKLSVQYDPGERC
jgi:hypothetical protein